MAHYYYKAIKPNGEYLTGEMDAPDRRYVISSLQDSGLLPVSAETDDSSSPIDILKNLSTRKRKLTHKEVTALTRELATILQAGVPLDHALDLVENITGTEKTRTVVKDIRSRIQAGSSLSEALAAYRNTFDNFYTSTVHAGEAAGALEQVLERLADYMENARQLRETIKTALVYPAILVGMTGLSLILLLTYVVPQFEPLFEDMGQAMPTTTQIVFSSAHILQDYWWLLLGLVILSIWLFGKYLSSDKGRYAWDKLMLKLPLTSNIVIRFEATRFGRTMGMLLENGVPLLSALAIVRDVINNRVIAQSLEPAINDIKHGHKLHKPLEEAGLFPPLAIRLIHVGEDTGNLDDMMKRIADTYEAELREEIRRVLILLEPVLILVLGVLIAGIILSVLSAILSLNNFVI